MFETTFILINLVCGFSRYNIRKIQHFSIIYFILICSLYVISKLRIELSKFYICDCISKITISLYNLNMFFLTSNEIVSYIRYEEQNVRRSSNSVRTQYYNQRTKKCKQKYVNIFLVFLFYLLAGSKRFIHICFLIYFLGFRFL